MNKILDLKTNPTSNQWCFNQEIIIKHVVQYFQNFYTTYFKSSPKNYKIYMVQHPALTQKEIDELEGDITLPILRASVFSFNPYKSPRPDGLHPHFFQQAWNIIHESLFKFTNHIFKTGIIPPKIN